MLLIALSLLVALAAIATIAAKLRHLQRLEYVFKPLTTALIIAIAALPDDPVSDRYQIAILIGLLASLIGDVALMLPDDRYFLAGLVAFLIAHLFYIAAFVLESSGSTSALTIIPFAIFAALMLRWLWSDLGSLRGPVMVYVTVITLMAWTAASRWLDLRETPALLAMAGAYLFVTSDSALAVERFRGSWRTAPVWVLSTYFAAQWLIALSIGS